MATLLSLVNDTLSLVGEQPLTSSAGNLGSAAKQSLASALYTVAAQTRHSYFISQQDFNVTTSYHLPSLSLPSRLIQLRSVYLKTTDTSGNVTYTRLNHKQLQLLQTQPGYCVVGNSLHVSQRYERPCTITVEAWIAPELPSTDGATLVGFPDELLPALEYAAASLLSLSYVDDLAQQAALQRRAEAEIEQIRRRAGSMRPNLTFRGY